MNLFSSFIIVPTILSSMVLIMMSYLLSIWFIMEISIFMVIGYMMISMKQKKNNFLMFSSTSSGFIYTSMLIYYQSNKFYFSGPYNNFYRLIYKTSCTTSSSMNTHNLQIYALNNYFFMLTMQKISPLIMFYLLNMDKNVFMLLIIMTLMVPSMIMINMKSIKMLITYSSINQTEWIVALIFLKHQFWLSYFMIYSSIVLLICLILSYTKISQKFFQYSVLKYSTLYLQ